MTDIQRWSTPLGLDLFSTEHDGQTIFAATQVCAGLAKTNVTDALSRLDEDEVVDLELVVDEVKIRRWVTEAGLYRLASTAKTDLAKKFQRQVFHVILPAIRRTGVYATEAVQTHLENLLSEQQILISDLQAEVAELRRHQQALPSVPHLKKPTKRCPKYHLTWSLDKFTGGFWYCTSCWAQKLPAQTVMIDYS